MAVTLEQILSHLQELARKVQHQEVLIQGMKTEAAQRHDIGDNDSDIDVGHKRKERDLDVRQFKECPRFKGDAAEWDNWAHALVMCAHQVPAVMKAMEDVLRQAGNGDDVNTLAIDTHTRDKFRGTLYFCLVSKTDGDAATLVRSVTTKTGGIKCGFGALALLAHRYNPKTPERILHHWGMVIDPPRVKDVRRLQVMVEQWEAKRSKLATEFNEELSETLKTAILVKMLPRDLQDIA